MTGSVYLRCLGMAVAATASMLLVLTPGASAAGSPDLSVTAAGPARVALDAPFTETFTVTNQGTAPTPGVAISYPTGVTVNPALTPALACTPVYRGHSGRGGGETLVGYSCAETLASPLNPGESTTIALGVTATSLAELTPTFTVAPSPAAAQLGLVSHTVTLATPVFVPPPAAAPTNVTVNQTGDQLNVHWSVNHVAAADIISSEITATPTGGSTAPVINASAHPTDGLITGIEPATRYAVTVVNTDAGGAGAPSAAVTFTTQVATVVPGAPAITDHWWAGSELALTWAAPRPGNSPIDEYEVSAVGSGEESSVTTTALVTGGSLSDYLSVDSSLDWAARVRAHNAAGWGGWSAPVSYAGLGG